MKERPKPHILDGGLRGRVEGRGGFMGARTKERDSTHWQGQWEAPLEGAAWRLCG